MCPPLPPPLPSFYLDLKFCVSIGGFLRDCIFVFKGFPGGAEVKTSACYMRDLGSIPGLRRSPGEGNAAPVFLPRQSHGWRGLVGYSTRVANSRIRLSDFTFTFMPWRRKWQPTPVFLPGESQGQRRLVGCCLWGRTELDTTEVT